MVEWLRKGASIKYVRNWSGDGGRVGGHPIYVQLRRGGGGVMTHVYVRTYTTSFHGVSMLISSIISARKNDIPFNSNDIQALK